MGLFDKLKEIRQKRNDRIDAIRRVESKLKSSKTEEQTTARNKEAESLSKKTGVSYSDALTYVEHKQKKERTQAAIRSTAMGLARAGKSSAANIESSGMFGTPKGKHDSMLDFSRVGGGGSIFGSTAGRGSESIFGRGVKRTGKRHRKQKHKTNKTGKSVTINVG